MRLQSSMPALDAPPMHYSHAMHDENLPAKVTLLEPSGFCAGVEASIKALVWMIEAFPGRRVFCYHEIVHNSRVVDLFHHAGVTFVSSIEDVPEGAPLMLSAHGTAPSVAAAARRRSQIVIDAVCPLVRKVHFEAQRRVAAGDDVIYLGHAGHDEAAGVLGIDSAAIHLVEKEARLNDLQDGRGISLLSQTTLSEEQYESLAEPIRRRFNDVWEPPRTDRCFATTNRQQVVRAFANECDALIIVGAANSANTLALRNVATQAGCPNVQRVNDPDEIVLPLPAHVAVTAGASAPDQVVQEVIDFLVEGDLARLHRFALDLDEPSFRAPFDLLRLVATCKDELPDASRVSDTRVRASQMLNDLIL